MAKPQLRIAAESDRGMNRRFNFTKDALAAIKPPASGRVYVYDLKEPGLEYMVTASGHRSFNLYRWDKLKQRPKRGSLDAETLDQARDLVRTAKGDMASGKDPFEFRKAIRESSTLGELWEHYKEKHHPECTPNTRKTDLSRWEVCLSDWKNKKAISITAEDVRNKHSQLMRKYQRDGKDGGTNANRAIQLMRAVYNFCRVEPNPAASKNWNAATEKKRKRFLRADEVQRLFAAVDKLKNKTIADFIRMSLFTGARKSNVLSMRWEHIDLKASTWTIPADESKSGEQMIVYLAAPAVEILKRRKRKGAYVFPGRKDGEHLADPKKTWENVRQKAGLEDLWLHDLRRTLISWMVASGASLPVAGKQAGHLDSATTEGYAHLDLDPVKPFVNAATSAMLAAATQPKKGGKRKAQ